VLHAGGGEIPQLAQDLARKAGLSAKLSTRLTQLVVL
jgi:hypothetical protein